MSLFNENALWLNELWNIEKSRSVIFLKLEIFRKVRIKVIGSSQWTVSIGIIFSFIRGNMVQVHVSRFKGVHWHKNVVFSLSLENQHVVS